MKRALPWLRTIISFPLGVIAVGIALELLQRHAGLPDVGVNGTTLVTAGVALFILLPVSRVLAMLWMFRRKRFLISSPARKCAG